MGAVTIDVTAFRYSEAERPALRDAHLTIEPGQFVLVTGPSGSGKTTLANLCNGLIPHVRGGLLEGGVVVDGRDTRQTSIGDLGLRVGTVFQDFRLLPSKSVYENVALAMEVIGKPRHAIETQVPDVLELVGLAGKEKRLPHELSGGEEQRVAIARAMVNRPELLLADEPTGNLDPDTSLGIMRLLDRINRNGTTVVMATHDAAIVNQMRMRVIELHDGTVARDQNSGVYGAVK